MDRDTVELLSRAFSLSQRTSLLLAIFFALLTSLYAAFVSFIFGKKLKSIEGRQAHELVKLQGQLSTETQLLVQELKVESDAALKRLESELARKSQTQLQRSQAGISEEQSKKQSRLDYEYEARKRLYHECEPLIFELLEFSETADNRVRSLARTARLGELPSWLSGRGYYMTSTIYLLFAPMAVYKLMRRRLTIVDLSLDRNVAIHYRLAKQLALSFVHDFFVSSRLEGGSLPYDPNNPEWRTLRIPNPKEYWRQGLPLGRFDNAVESLIIRDNENGGNSRVRSFGEFETEFRKPGSVVEETFSVVQDMFTDFHPASRPILWRLLVIQAHIHASIVRFHRRANSDTTIGISPIVGEQRERYFWAKALSQADQETMEEPFKIAEAYFKSFIPDLWDESERVRVSSEKAAMPRVKSPGDDAEPS